MGSGIEMQGIHDIVIAGDRIRSGLIYILGPVGRSDYDDSIFVIFSDHRDHFFRIGLDPAPAGAAVGLVADLIENVVLAVIGLRHFRKKCLCLFLIGIGIVIGKDMPVYDHIHIICSGILHAVFH